MVRQTWRTAIVSAEATTRASNTVIMRIYAQGADGI